MTHAVIAIHRDTNAAYLDDGAAVPVAQCLDAACEPCEPEDAAWCLVGPIPGARQPWLNMPVETLDAVRH